MCRLCLEVEEGFDQLGSPSPSSLRAPQQVTTATDVGNHTASFNGSYNFCNQQVYATNGVLLPAASYAQVSEAYLSCAPLTCALAPNLPRNVIEYSDHIHAAVRALQLVACTAFPFLVCQ